MNKQIIKIVNDIYDFIDRHFRRESWIRHFSYWLLLFPTPKSPHQWITDGDTNFICAVCGDRLGFTVFVTASDTANDRTHSVEPPICESHNIAMEFVDVSGCTPEWMCPECDKEETIAWDEMYPECQVSDNYDVTPIYNSRTKQPPQGRMGI